MMMMVKSVTTPAISCLGLFTQVGAEGLDEGSEQRGGGKGDQKIDEQMKDEPPVVWTACSPFLSRKFHVQCAPFECYVYRETRKKQTASSLILLLH